jgi:hypothetical protein
MHLHVLRIAVCRSLIASLHGAHRVILAYSHILNLHPVNRPFNHFALRMKLSDPSSSPTGRGKDLDPSRRFRPAACESIAV